PESFAASSVAKNAIGIARCTRSLSFLEMNRSKSKSLISAATRQDSFDASKRVIGPVPLIPRAVASQNASRPIPLGLTAPIPVPTTLFNSIKSSSSPPVLGSCFLASCRQSFTGGCGHASDEISPSPGSPLMPPSTGCANVLASTWPVFYHEYSRIPSPDQWAGPTAFQAALALCQDCACRSRVPLRI